MPIVDYPLSAQYLPAGPQGGLSPALAVELIRGAQRTRAVGIVDSGATITVFNPEHAEILGIEDVTGGDEQHLQTQSGGVYYYVFDDLEIEVRLEAHVNRFPCRIGFFATRRPRNILGRDPIFRHYQIGFHDRTETIHLRPDD